MSTKPQRWTANRSVTQTLTKPSPASQTIVSTMGPLQWVDSMVGVQNPRWKSQIRGGLDASTEYRATKRIVSATSGPGYWNLSDPKNNLDGNIQVSGSWATPEWGSPGSDQGNASNIAISNLAKSVQSAYSTFQGLVAAAEAGKTGNMIVDRLGSLQGVIRTFNSKARLIKKARDLRTAKGRKKALKDLNGLYLEFTYGWTPLASDIQSLIAEMNKLETKTVGVSGVGKYETSTTSMSSGSVGFQAARYKSSKVSRKSYSVRYKGSLILSVAGKPVPKFGSELPAFVPTLYELLPWSFVVDYFSNVGSAVTAMSYSGVRFQYLFYNTKNSAIIEETYTAIPGSQVTAAYGGWSYTTTVEETKRFTTPPILPTPGLYLKPPSTKQWVNIASLVYSLL